MYEAETIDIAVVGGGHAGCEAALAAARLGMETVLFAISLDSIEEERVSTSVRSQGCSGCAVISRAAITQYQEVGGFG